MMNQDKKCICKKCSDCRLYLSWDMTGDNGLRKNMKMCVFEVLAGEIPKLNGTIEGFQQSAEESRNRAEETKNLVGKFLHAAAISMSERPKKIE